MAARRYKGGGIFTDDLTGGWTTLSKFLFLIAGLTVLGLLIWMIVALVLKYTQNNTAPSPQGGSVAPPMSGTPGRVTIAEIAQAPSSGQAIIYFSKAEAAGTTCDTCEVEFNVTTTYTGAYPSNPDPVTNVTTAPLSAGAVYITYTPQNPRGADSLPTQVQINVTATVVNPVTGVRGGPVSASTQLPYIGD
jgi:hypothetical protein